MNSNQEECRFLGEPCLLLRNVSEHEEGLDTNVVVSESSADIVDNFLRHYHGIGPNHCWATSHPLPSSLILHKAMPESQRLEPAVAPR